MVNRFSTLCDMMLITLISTLYACFSFGQCTNAVLDLGPDAVICPNSSYSVSVPSVFNNVVWNDGSTDLIRDLSAPGTYIVSVEIIGNNLVTNGDFNAGNSAFSSDYVTGSSLGGGSWGMLSNEGSYEVCLSPDDVHVNFSYCNYNGNMLVVNGSSVPNSNVWCQSVSVDPNTTYLFSTDVSNALFDFNVANLQFFINGSQIGSVFSTSSNGCDWQTFSDSWLSGTATSAQICIVNQNTAVGGNDFALDNIYFAPVCSLSDTIIISEQAPFSFTLGNDTSFCSGSAFLLNYDLNGTDLSFINGSGTTTKTLLLDTFGSFNVTVSDGCTQVNDQINIGIIPAPAVLFLTPDLVLCQPEAVDLSVQFSQPGSIQWSINGSLIAENSPQINYTPPPSGAQICAMLQAECGSSQACMNIGIEEVQANFEFTEVIGEIGLVQCHDQSISSGVITSLLWQVPGSTEYSSSLSDPFFHFENADQAYISLLVETEHGCVDSITKLVEFPGAVFIYIPNSFTPDGFKLNNTWFYVIDGILNESFNMQVFNRWGEQIWQSNDPNTFWDGTFQGKTVPQGSYNWFLKYRLNDQDDPLYLSGHLNVIY